MTIFKLNRAYESAGHSAEEVKAEVEMHLKEKDILEAIVPSSIIIGPFFINTEGTRQALGKKRKALSNAVLELLARQLRKQADDVSIEIHFDINFLLIYMHTYKHFFSPLFSPFYSF